MLKRLLLLSLIISSAFTAKASHMMGGELTVKVSNGNIAYFTLTTYRDLYGVSFSPSVYIDINQGSINLSTLLNRVLLDTIPSNFYPVEINVYEGSINLGTANFNPVLPITASYDNCCRNNAIQNLTNPGGLNMVLETNFLLNTNSSPVFLAAPIIDWPTDTLWSYNPMPYDAQGDSLYWRLDTPKVSAGNVIANAPGFTYPPAHPGGDITIDPATGIITYNASQIGNYVYSVLVEEFDSLGSKIGEIRRDMQIVCRPDTITSGMNLVLNNSSTQTQNGLPVVNLLADSTQVVTFSLSTNDSNATLSMSASGEPFQLANSDASFSSILYKSSAQTLEGTFSWTPQVTDLRSKVYQLNLRISDGLYQYDYTMGLTVNGVVSLQETKVSGSFSLYPNPVTSGTVTLKAGKIEAGIYSARILDMSGRLIIEKQDLHLAPGDKLEFKEALVPGSYIFRLYGPSPSSEIFMVK